jgi:hypothetical protein
MEDPAEYKTARVNERDVKHGAKFGLRGETVTVQTVWQHGGIWWIRRRRYRGVFADREHQWRRTRCEV